MNENKIDFERWKQDNEEHLKEHFLEIHNFYNYLKEYWENEKEKYFVLSKDKGDIIITSFKAEDRNKANEIFEEEMKTNFSSDWLLDEDDFRKLKKEVLKCK